MAEDRVPANAERFDLFDVVTYERKPSQHIRGRTALVPEVHCPGCNRTLEYPGFEKTLACQCGVFIQDRLAGVYVWRETRESVDVKN